MHTPDVSVIIPTHNRKQVLKKCIEAFTGQTYPQNNFEVIVVDDGSRDKTQEMLKGYAKHSTFKLGCYYQEHKGPAAARNLGVKHAQAELIIIIGDDILVSPEFINDHIKIHEGCPENIIAVGHISWAKSIKLTPFMRYLEERKLLFNYQDIPDPQNVPYNFFYTCNVSLNKQLLLDEGFDEDYRRAMFEDVELAYRLSKKGIRIVYAKEAIGYHDHPIILHHFLKRTFISGFYTMLTHKKHPLFFPHPPEINKLKQQKLKALIYPFLARLISPLDYFLGIDFSCLYARLLDYYKFKGLQKGKEIFQNGH